MPPIRRSHNSKFGTQSSEVDSTLGIKRWLTRSASSIPFVLLNTSLFIFLVWDVVKSECATAQWLLPGWRKTAFYSEWLCLLFSLLNTFSSLFIALWPRLKIEFIQLTPKQIQLLGMLDFSKCFGVRNMTPSQKKIESPQARSGSPFFALSDLDWLFTVKHSPGSGIKRRNPGLSSSVLNDSRYSNNSGPSHLYRSHLNQSASSPLIMNRDYSPGQSPVSFTLGSNASTPRSYASPGSSPGTPFQDKPINRSVSFYRPDLINPVQASHRESLARLRRAKSSSPFTNKRHIRSSEQLRKYLKEFEDENDTQGPPRGTQMFGNGNWGKSFQDLNGSGLSTIAERMPCYELAPLVSDESVGSFPATPLSPQHSVGTTPPTSNDWIASMLSRSLSVEPTSSLSTTSLGRRNISGKRRSESGMDRSSQIEKKEGEDMKTYLLWEKSHFEDAMGATRNAPLNQLPENTSLLKEEGYKIVMQQIMPCHWIKYGLDPNDLDLYTQNLRSWISRTVLKPIVSEIDSLNKIFENQARPDLRLGDASLASLQHILLSRSQEQLPTLHRLLPYLEIHSNQEYVVRRLRDLAKDGILQNFKPHSGGPDIVVGSSGKSRSWDSHLPCDEELLWHVLATYFDAQLPPDPLCPDGKSFSAKYLLTSPAEPRKIQKAPHAYYIWNSAKTPANYRFIYGMESAPKSADGSQVKFGLDVGNGRNSLFHALLLFLAYTKSEEDGNLGQISLGQSGLNLLWVIEE